MKLFLQLIIFVFSTALLAQTPVNDECDNRILLSLSTTEITSETIDLTQATQSVLSSCDNISNTYYDAWYEFVAPVNGNVQITGIGGFDNVTFYEGCEGVELTCFTDDGFLYGVTQNATYVLRMSRRSNFAGVVTFGIQAFAESGNNECEDRTNLDVTTTEISEYTVDLRGATESTDSSCDSAGNTNLDVFYEFMAPATGSVRITGIGGFDNVTFYDGCDGTELTCFTDDGFLYGVTQNTPYVLRMSRRAIFASVVTFGLQGFVENDNNECDDRTTITITTTDVSEYTVDLRGATESTDSSCDTSGNTNLDVFYEFTAPVTGNVRITGIGGFDNITFYDACEGAELACFTNDGFLYGVTQNSNYVLRIARRSNFADIITFGLQVFQEVVNDACVDRTNIDVTTTEILEYTVALSSATESLDSSCENSGNENLDVFYEFTAPVTGNIQITGLGGFDNITLYDSCEGTELTCFTNNGFLYDVIENTTYILRMARISNFADTITFGIQAFEREENDECDMATEINIGVLEYTEIPYDLRGATESMNADCQNENNENLDVFYKFNMPVNGNIEISNLGGFDVISLYDACNGTELYCAVGNGIIFNLTSGTEYILRGSRWSVFANTVSLRVQAVEAPLPGCTDTVEFIGGAWVPNPPNFNTNAIIRSNYTTEDYGSFQACSLSVDLLTSVNIAAGDYIEVAYGIDNNGVINVAHEGNIVQRNAASEAINNGTINVSVTTPTLNDGDFMMLGSPMSTETSNDVFGNVRMVRNHSTENFVPNLDVANDFPMAENFADDNGDNWVNYTGAINVGEGYLIRPQSEAVPEGTYTLTYSEGTLNTGDISIPALFNTTKNDSPNIFSNPYASAISAVDLINANSVIDEVYFWEHLTPPNASLPGYNNLNFSMQDISMYNLMGGVAAASDPSGTETEPNGFISTAQGFGIKANAAGTVTFTNTMRRVSNNNTLRRHEVDEVNRLWLQVENRTYGMQSTTLVGFTSEATFDVDAGYDSRRMATVLSLFSETEHGDELGIQGVPQFNTNMKIPVGFSTQLDASLEYRISISEVQGVHLETTEIFLLDTELNITTNLSEEVYEFTAEAGTFNSRFMVLFEDRTLSVSENNLEGIVLYPNPAQDRVVVSNLNREYIESISIYDISGRVIYSQAIESAVQNISIPVVTLESAVYILSVKGTHGSVTKQLIKN
ncbi:T9SS type A sorting domain-containing protein [Cochleicola gelatinilyticus]|uniref:Uncharacterized protein n=1 Tax=Cochleicola gelatinilyticus TaxID=1763537 RepID=A0A167IV27_9FLAO|nr:T9SS type A sorting domain-containing protein [Cochleicola gelatinilyticus]OAB80046.1 hypothetical protein ULVI_04715 [Cochleicola gelatinilyticus]